MDGKSMNTIKLKQINRNKVYNYIYKERATCKLDIAKNLEMSISTVTQNLKSLEEEHLIYKDGFFDSTGGRKSEAVVINKNIKISIGIAILQDSFDIVAVNLYGELLCFKTITLKYVQKKKYFKSIGKHIKEFIACENLVEENILGVSIAIQGIVSNDGQSVIYGKILDNLDMKLVDFMKFIEFPCRMEHDSKSAGRLEIWGNNDVENAIVLLLNLNLGGAIIANKTVQNGDNMRSGIIEHLSLTTDGDTCYCGKKGCFETYCSAKALIKMSNMSITEFFKNIEENHDKSIEIWHTYLDNLAYAISNLNLIFNGKIILNGTVSCLFRDVDLIYLIQKTNEFSIFEICSGDIIISKNGQFSQSIGSALFYIEEFLKFE